MREDNKTTDFASSPIRSRFRGRGTPGAKAAHQSVDVVDDAKKNKLKRKKTTTKTIGLTLRDEMNSLLRKRPVTWYFDGDRRQDHGCFDGQPLSGLLHHWPGYPMTPNRHHMARAQTGA